MNYEIPKEVLETVEKLEEAGFEAYLVGGCVRDILLKRNPKDWDITTNARPSEIQKTFENTFYENKFGTVGVITGSKNPTLEIIEITPYRLEAKYTDKRHPDIVRFAGRLEDDLKRRDFTINALALKISQLAYTYSQGTKSAKETGLVNEKFIKIIDLWKGREDLKKKIIKTVGEAEDRFNEDALRMLRAVRLASELKFNIEKNTEKAIKKLSSLLKMISKERIREEFNKIIMSDNPDWGIKKLHDLNLLKYIVPELEEGIGVSQNKEHIFTVWEHNLRSLKHAAEKKYSLEVRLAALFHDIAKPRTKRGEGPNATFYNHEILGAKMTAQILTRLRYPKKTIEKIIRLVRWHLFFSDTDIITLSAVRRVIRNVGKKNIWDLMKVRFCDRVGMGRPKEEPYRLRKYEAMVEEALRDPLSVSMLKINGNDVMKIAQIQPGPKVGHILHALLEEVLDNPKLNNKKYLKERTKELAKLPEEKIEQLGGAARRKKEDLEKKEIAKIRKKYRVE